MPRHYRTQEELTDKVLADFRKQAPHNAIRRTGLSFSINEGIPLDLTDLYKAIAHQNPDRQRDSIETYVDGLIGFVEIAKADSVKAIKDNVMPRIYPQHVLATRDAIARVPFVNDTDIAFTAGRPGLIVTLTTDQLKKWKTCIEEVEDLALSNLDRYAQGISMMYQLQDGKKTIVPLEGGTYNSSLILSRKLHQRLSPRLGNEFYVGIASRDMFVAIPSDSKARVKEVEERLRKIHETELYPITPHLFRVVADGVIGTIPEPTSDDY